MTYIKAPAIILRKVGKDSLATRAYSLCLCLHEHTGSTVACWL
jgi:hypothetical protein